MSKATSAASVQSSVSAVDTTDPTPQKKTRSREGCFQCRKKKRKCDVVRPRCGACTRGDSVCTFPPREWDPVEGRMITVRQPNKRKRQLSNESPNGGLSATAVAPATPAFASSSSPYKNPLSDTSFFEATSLPPSSLPPAPLNDPPIDPALMNGTHDMFSIFCEPYGQNTTIWPFPELAHQESGDPFSGPNMLFDLGLSMSFTQAPERVKAMDSQSFDTLLEMGNQPRLSTSDSLMDDQPERATVEEMKVFWQELLQLYDNMGDHYFYAVSPSGRKKIAQTLTTENFSDVHLAASAFLCAARRVLLYQHEGDTAKASEWGQRAMTFHRAARDMLADETFPLCSRVGAGIDFRLGHILQDDPVGAQALQEMNRSIIRQQLGPQPTWFLTDRIDNSTISLTTFITTDVLYALSHKGVRTAFDVRVADLPMDADPGLRVHMGIPSEVLSAIARIVNLAVDMDEADSFDMGKRAKEVEDGLQKWKPEIRSGLNAPCLTETVAVQAMWREAARMLLYQLLFQHGILSKPMRSSLSEFLRTAEMLPQGSVGDDDQPRLFIPASRACAWFIASTNAISPTERALCLKGLHGCGNEKAFRDNASAAQALWNEMDRTGMAPRDWRQFLADHKLRLVFL